MRVRPEANGRQSEEAELRIGWFGLWDAFFAVSYLVTSVLLFISADSGLGHSLAIGALTLIVPWYAMLGRRPMIEKTYGPRNLVFAFGLVLLFCITTTFGLIGSFALFAVSPMLIMSLPMTWAVGLLGVVNLFPLTLVWADGADVWGVLAISLLSFALSILLGLWIKRVTQQSKERAQLIEELRRSRERVARLSHEAGISAERERLAREIHDTLAQGLTSIISLIHAAESRMRDEPEQAAGHLSRAGQVAKDSLAEARDFVAARTPPTLRGGSLVQAVRRHADGLVAETGLDVRTSVHGQEAPLPMPVNVVLLRAVQEAIANVRKHAGRARGVDVEVTFEPDAVRLLIRDDGEGFDPDDAQGGYGLRGMRARVAEIDGTVTIGSRPGAGTTVEVHIPMEAARG
ncbi:sensor histidine kinase [Microbispora rosea]|uniref:sensor histidine kinase n=1 Tax=Microbispora rosea TaxID=58117 RepID=UPI001950BE36|nr:sensor histidine kinase [Microbispora rosea]GIH50973.1 two-component sensor histidine kinase [Microbispora rosea subsp. rosea]